MSFTKTEAEKRSAVLNAINVALADMDRLRARLADAEAAEADVLARIKSEKGTAQAELDKAAERYAELKDRLEALLPAGEVATGKLAERSRGSRGCFPPTFTSFVVTEPTLIFSLEAAIETLGEDEGRFLADAFVSGAGDSGIWAVPHPESKL